MLVSPWVVTLRCVTLGCQDTQCIQNVERSVRNYCGRRMDGYLSLEQEVTKIVEEYQKRLQLHVVLWHGSVPDDLCLGVCGPNVVRHDLSPPKLHSCCHKYVFRPLQLQPYAIQSLEDLLQLIAAVPATWVWKNDTNTLELVSLLMTPDVKDRKPVSKIRPILESLDQHKPKVGISGHNIALLRKEIDSRKILANALEAQKSAHRHKQFVTLEDVKNAAFLLLKENDSMTIPTLFQPMLGTRQLNEFLMALLNYFNPFLYKFELETKPRQFMTNICVLEKTELVEVESKMELARKHLAQTYSGLLLGLGMADQHHMACGKAIGSFTHKDRHLFECLYTYCTYVTWVTYSRKNMDVIKSEVGRLLRSNVFNKAQLQKGVETNLKPSIGEYRLLHRRRPPLNSILNQRSPVLKSLLQTPKEKSEYLFKQHQVNPDFSTHVADEKTRVTRLDSNLSDDVGIIGEPLSNFFSDTLVSIDTYLESKGKGPVDETLLQKSGYSVSGMVEASTGRTSSRSRNAMTSRATTVAIESEHGIIHDFNSIPE
uniref:protein phosphatase 1 regulatory subunit 36 n=1 Tax=Pristiophorus japonicus TaxID=55135 RepID=UPI00398E50FD